MSTTRAHVVSRARIGDHVLAILCGIRGNVVEHAEIRAIDELESRAQLARLCVVKRVEVFPALGRMTFTERHAVARSTLTSDSTNRRTVIRARRSVHRSDSGRQIVWCLPPGSIQRTRSYCQTSSGFVRLTELARDRRRRGGLRAGSQPTKHAKNKNRRLRQASTHVILTAANDSCALRMD